MALTKIYVFVEGSDDVLYFENIIKPILLKYYDDVDIIQYAQMRRDKVSKYIGSIQMLNFDYFLVADIDQEPSVNSKRNFILSHITNLEREKIIVVISEIESWYLAGIPTEISIKWGMQDYATTDYIVKEKFNSIRPYMKKIRSRVDFMYEILKVYNIDTAIQKNKSLKYFYNLITK